MPDPGSGCLRTLSFDGLPINGANKWGVVGIPTLWILTASDARPKFQPKGYQGPDHHKSISAVDIWNHPPLAFVWLKNDGAVIIHFLLIFLLGVFPVPLATIKQPNYQHGEGFNQPKNTLTILTRMQARKINQQKHVCFVAWSFFGKQLNKNHGKQKNLKVTPKIEGKKHGFTW